ncbi:checkpoint protein HUS1-like [Paramacrobiotus metropolitanus]|uniref:checkpoint protein HUS1-like n=1 Tax=Paramacrobiotus metropolitanus TaxID=2943436 RepID=UPI002446268B|nr:checkpoint protein HUS1-like [Paramacrobiotus metropolitanus]
MKFRCKMSDLFSIQHFYRILQTVAKLCDTTCIVRMTPTRMFIFTKPASMIDGGAYVLAEMHPEVLFDEYNMVGYAPDANEIFIEVNPEVLLRGFRVPQKNAKYIKIKLTNRVGPCMCVESELPSMTMRSKFTTHDTPIIVLARSVWKDITPPEDIPTNIGHQLSSLKLFKTVVDRMRILGQVCATISASREKLSVDVGGPTSEYEICSHFEDLENTVDSSVDTEDLTETEEEIALGNGLYSVKVDIRRLCAFLSAQQYSSNRVTLSIRHKRHLVLLLGDDNKFRLRFVLPGQDCEE